MISLTIITVCGITAVAYVIGSIPTGILLTRLITGRDIRRLGSGNVGATNVRRVAGNRLGVVVLGADMLKGVVPVFLAMQLHTIPGSGFFWESGVALAAFGAFAGHLYPVYFKGRSGGKGVATAAGCFLLISPVALAGAGAVFILSVWHRRMVSMGSLTGVAVLPAFLWLSSRSIIFTVLAVVMAVFIFYRHGANIRRIREGTEPRI
jgi:acyl phosphate:glycerol-3-phosphate acyltransferase